MRYRIGICDDENSTCSELEIYIAECFKGKSDIGDAVTRQCKVEKINSNTFKIILTQGLNKQIRRMSKSFGYTVIKLERVRIMNIKLDDIGYGKWRNITFEELKILEKHILWKMSFIMN